MKSPEVLKHADLLAFVSRHLLHGNKAFYVQGAQGAGKTRFALQLAQYLEGHYRVILTSANPMVDVKSVLLRELGQEEDLQVGWVDLLAGRLVGQKLLVIMDDADSLARDELDDLFKLRAAGIAVLLLGSREITEKHFCDRTHSVHLSEPDRPGVVDLRLDLEEEIAVEVEANEEAPGDSPPDVAQEDIGEEDPRHFPPMYWLIPLVLLGGVFLWLQFDVENSREPQTASDPDAGKDILESAGSPDLIVTPEVNSVAAVVTTPAVDPPLLLSPQEEKSVRDVAPSTADSGKELTREPRFSREEEHTQWLKTRNAKHYTLQLLATRDRDALSEYARKYGISADSAVFHRSKGGRSWYSLVWGDFPDIQSADRAKAGLPKAIIDAGVWPRAFAGIQEQLD